MAQMVIPTSQDCSEECESESVVGSWHSVLQPGPWPTIPQRDLIDRVPDELCNEVRDIVQETGIKTIPIQKKCKKAKWLSEEV